MRYNRGRQLQNESSPAELSVKTDETRVKVGIDSRGRKTWVLVFIITNPFVKLN